MNEIQRYPYKTGRYGSHAVIERLMGPGAGRTALDIGCGGGFVAWPPQKALRDRLVSRMDESHLRGNSVETFEAVIFGGVL